MTIESFSRTIYKTPVVNFLCSGLSALVMWLVGWRIVGDRPTHKKYILLAVPHTSNWDFAVLTMTAFRVKIDIHWMGKHTLFSFPFRNLMIWLGGIPVDRSKTSGVVDQMAEHFSRSEELIIVVTPEGTRSRVSEWKTGFYHIAERAQVPIVLGFVDSQSKRIGFGSDFWPTGDLEGDLEKIQAFYKDKRGIQPDNQ